MKINKGKTKLGYLLGLLPIILVLLIGIVFSGAGHKAAVAGNNTDSVYTYVLDDLNVARNFNVKNYPARDNDFSPELIHLAIGDSNELYVYVYLPYAAKYNMPITSVRLAHGTFENPKNYADYAVELCNSDGTIFKYKLKSLSLEYNDKNTCYIEAVALFRKWNKDVDKASDNTGTILNEVAFEIGQYWTITKSGNDVIYDYVQSDSISITGNYVGELVYRENDVDVFQDYNVTHNFFIAFSTDHYISDLYEADVEFTILETNGLSKDDPERMEFTVVPKRTETIFSTEIDHATATPSAWDIFNWGKKLHKWPKIEDSNAFIEREILTEKAKDEVRKCRWVLRFYSLQYTFNHITHKETPAFYEADDTTILRLKFSSQGIVYNLGVIHNKVASDNKVDGGIVPGGGDVVFGESSSGWHWYTYVILALCVIVGIILLPFIVRFVIWFIKWIISLFRG